MLGLTEEMDSECISATCQFAILIAPVERVTGVSVAKGHAPHFVRPSRRVLRTAVPEGRVVEVGQHECQGVELNVEEVEEENSKDDCMNGRWWWIFALAQQLSIIRLMSRAVWCEIMWTVACGVCTVHTPRRLEWNSSTANEIKLQRQKKNMRIQQLQTCFWLRTLHGLCKLRQDTGFSVRVRAACTKCLTIRFLDNEQMWSSSHLALILCFILRVQIVPFIPDITLPPRWRRRRTRPKFPSRLWINCGALTVRFLKLASSFLLVLILRWNRLLVVFWLPVQVILQWDGGFVILSKS